MKTTHEKPVLMIGLDAAEVTLIERWMGEGSLPNLRRLRDRGAFGSLRSSADWLVGSPWPTFYTSRPPAEHGFYHYLMWRSDFMDTQRPRAERIPLEPFWRALGDEGRRVIALDVPITYAPVPFEGLELSGWGTHETLEEPASYPPELLDEVRASFGNPPLGGEESYFLTPAELLDVRDRCVRTTEIVADAGVDLVRRHPWDLFLICFATTHRAGHQLWSATNQLGEATPDVDEELRNALKSVYVACDQAVGRLVEAAGSDVATLVFSVHGMGPNASRTDLLRELLARILEDRAGEVPGVVRRMRELMPLKWRTRIKHRLPRSVQDRLTLFWRTGGIDWSHTRAFAVFGDLEGYVRVNLEGREAAGIIEPGAAYEAICRELIEGLLTFRDADTGEPLVSSIGRREELYPTGEMNDVLPDLIIRWSPRPAAEHRAVVSDRYGEIAWPTPGRHPQGRSGNHKPDGFLIAAADGIAPGSDLSGRHVMDLAPTVYRLMGLEPPAEMRGQALF